MTVSRRNNSGVHNEIRLLGNHSHNYIRYHKICITRFIPVLIAGIIACILNRPICMLSEKTHLKRPFICVPVVVLFFIIIGILFGAAGGKIVEGMKETADALPSLFTEVVFPFLEAAADKLDGLLAVPGPDAGEIFFCPYAVNGKRDHAASGFLF